MQNWYFFFIKIKQIGFETSALITAVGPELPNTIGTIEHTRTSFLIACSMMFKNPEPKIQAEAIYCLQQLHLFAPRFVQLDRLVKNICVIALTIYFNYFF